MATCTWIQLKEKIEYELRKSGLPLNTPIKSILFNSDDINSIEVVETEGAFEASITDYSDEE